MICNYKKMCRKHCVKRIIYTEVSFFLILENKNFNLQEVEKYLRIQMLIKVNNLLKQSRNTLV